MLLQMIVLVQPGSNSIRQAAAGRGEGRSGPITV